jgi:hypothetical protein
MNTLDIQTELSVILSRPTKIELTVQAQELELLFGRCLIQQADFYHWIILSYSLRSQHSFFMIIS